MHPDVKNHSMDGSNPIVSNVLYIKNNIVRICDEISQNQLYIKIIYTSSALKFNILRNRARLSDGLG